MSESGEKSDSLSVRKSEKQPVKPVSVHRAFIYSALGPGWGEVYAGSRMRGYVTALIFGIFFIWFNWIIIKLFLGIFEGLIGNIDPSGELNFSGFKMGVSILLLYYVWSWGVLSAVITAMKQRRRNQAFSQKNDIWGLAISYICPGVGHIYAGKGFMGYILFIGFLLGILLFFPLCRQMWLSLDPVTKSDQPAVYDPYDMIERIKTLYLYVKTLVIQAKYSFAYIYSSLVRYFSVISTIMVIQNIKDIDSNRSGKKTTGTPPPLPGEFSDHFRWVRRSAGNGAGLFIIGWICPGSGQFLQKRLIAGWLFFTAYFSSMILIGFMLGTDTITPQDAEYLTWISTVVQLAAMVEAPARMKKAL